MNYIDELKKYNDSLRNYDITIAHPTSFDTGLLYDEINKRKSFRVILTTGKIIELGKNGYSEEYKIEESKQCIFYTGLDTEEIVNLIENGW